MMNGFEQSLDNWANEKDQKLDNAAVTRLVERVLFFRHAGMQDDVIQAALGLTGTEMTLVRNRLANR
ncbi:MAG: hypothetical protein J0M34_02255 [Alphaproteobacteria bacterium]|nr:hypothetical protein [Alphaproteobacteria bacterium]